MTKRDKTDHSLHEARVKDFRAVMKGKMTAAEFEAKYNGKGEDR